MADDLHDRLTALADQLPAAAAAAALDVPALRRAARARRTRRRTGVVAAVATVASLAVAVPIALGEPRGAGDRLTAPQVAASPDEPIALEVLSLPLRAVVQFEGVPYDAPDVAFSPSRVTASKDVSADAQEFRSFAVAFEPVPVASRCIIRATLRLGDARWVDTGDVRAYPSAALSLADGRVPPNGDRPTTLLDNRPYGQLTDAADGTAVDVTEIVRLWADGGTFPSRLRFVPKGSPVVLLVRPAALDYGTFAVSWDVARTPPSLDLELATDCPADAATPAR